MVKNLQSQNGFFLVASNVTEPSKSSVHNKPYGLMGHWIFFFFRMY